VDGSSTGTSVPSKWVLLGAHSEGGAAADGYEIGLDIAKSVFQLQGIDAAGSVVIRRQLKGRYLLAFFEKLPSCLIGIEACATSHHWSRELQAHSLRRGVAFQ
jgi:transposase